jgi:hypothetical protein
MIASCRHCRCAHGRAKALTRGGGIPSVPSRGCPPGIRTPPWMLLREDRLLPPGRAPTIQTIPSRHLTMISARKTRTNQPEEAANRTAAPLQVCRAHHLHPPPMTAAAKLSSRISALASPAPLVVVLAKLDYLGQTHGLQQPSFAPPPRIFLLLRLGVWEGTVPAPCAPPPSPFILVQENNVFLHGLKYTIGAQDQIRGTDIKKTIKKAVGVGGRACEPAGVALSIHRWPGSRG